jgi:uncharacterized phage-associated protein
MRFVFDISKSIAATAYLCSLHGGNLTVLFLVKMLYLADRKALIKWQRPITGDRFCSLPHGPIVSRIYDLMRGRVPGEDQVLWYRMFNRRQGNDISLIGEPDVDPLSQRELDVLKEAFDEIEAIPRGQLVDVLHARLPEWKDPNGSSMTIDPDMIFVHENFDADEIEKIKQDLKSFHLAKATLQSTQ